jgi:hypothetical protein
MTQLLSSVRQLTKIPYLSQYDTTSQEITTAGTPQLMTFDTDVYHSDITRTSSSRFTVIYAGTYLVAFSGIADLKGGANRHLEVFIKVGGAAVTNSNRVVHLPTASIETTVAVTFLVELAATNYFELWTSGDVSAGATGVQWLAAAAAATPGGLVGCPSLIMTCNMVSR